MRRILAIGYGNPGRLDDGLGPALADALERQAIAGLTVERDYQLTVEDAAAIAEHDAVVFVDASVNGPAPFTFDRVAPCEASTVGFSSHSIEPPALMALARDLFDSEAQGYVLAIRGYDFNEFGEHLSDAATANLGRALGFLVPLLREGRLQEAVAP